MSSALFSCYNERMNTREWLTLFKDYIMGIRQYSVHTATAYETDVLDFARFCETEDLGYFNQASERTAKFYMSELNSKYPPQTVIRKVSALRSYFYFLLDQEAIKSHPFLDVTLPKKPRIAAQFLYDEDVRAMFTAIDQTSPKGIRDYTILFLFYTTGLRVSELTTLTLKDIDPNERLMKVHGKGGKDRFVPLSLDMVAQYETYLLIARAAFVKKKRHTKVFVNQKGDPLTPGGVRYLLKEVMRLSASFLNVTPHMLRHTFASHMIKKGADLRSVQELLGHANLSSTQIYTHVAKDDMIEKYQNAHPRGKKQ